MIPLYTVTKRYLRSKDTNMVKVKGWKKYNAMHQYQKSTIRAILLWDETDFKIKIFSRDKEDVLHLWNISL